MYDLLIKGGRVIDPAQDINGIQDVAVNAGKIVGVAVDIPPSEGRQVIDAAGKIVTPGLIDLHCHAYPGVVFLGCMPDDAGVNQGVTTVVDGGSAGQATLGGFTKFVIPAARTRTYCFLHLGSVGLCDMPEFKCPEEINLEATATAIEANPDIIKGIKLRLVGNLMASDGIRVIEMAKKLAGDFGLPIMVHLGDGERRVPAELTGQCLSMMDRGDIASHIYTGNWGSPLRDDGTVLPEITAAMQRGVVMDVSPGMNNFSFNVAKKSLAQGIVPTTISTDLTKLSLTNRVYGLTVTMSKLITLGLTLEQAVTMAATNPARVLGISDQAGSLKPGMEADISIFAAAAGQWRFDDSVGDTLDVTELLMPVMAVKSGQPIPARPLTNLPSR